MRRSLVVGVLVTSLLAPVAARAHQGTQALVELRVHGERVELVLRATAADLAPTLEVAAGVRPVPTLYRAKASTVLKNVAAYLTMSVGGGRRCDRAARRLEIEGDRLRLTLEYACPGAIEELELRYDLLFDDDPLHRALVAAREEPGAPSAALTSGQRVFRLTREVSVWRSAWTFLRLGVHHIFTGYDHLCFLLALLLAAGARRRRDDDATRPAPLRAGLLHVLGVVTAFTVAHSATLVLSALGVLALPPRVVEPAIAVTILYVAVENLLAREPRLRWLLTFGFGLVHGFGFAHVLRELGLPRRGLLLSLLAFNGGVEVGQLAVVSLLFPVLHLLARARASVRDGVRDAAISLALLAALFVLLAAAGVGISWHPAAAGLLLLGATVGVRRAGYRRAVLQAGSALIALLALLWLVERVAGLRLLGGHLG